MVKVFVEGCISGGNHFTRGRKKNAPAFLFGHSVSIAQQDTFEGSGHDFCDMLLNTDVGFNAEGAKVTKAGEMAVVDFIRRSVVRVGLAGHTVMNVHRSDNGFTPESRRE